MFFWVTNILLTVKRKSEQRITIADYVQLAKLHSPEHPGEKPNATNGGVTETPEAVVELTT